MSAARVPMSDSSEVSRLLGNLEGTVHGFRERVDVAIEKIEAVDTAIRGDGDTEGLLSRVANIERAVEALQKADRLKFLPPAEETVLARYKMWAIWGGATLAALSLAADVIPYMRGE